TRITSSSCVEVALIARGSPCPPAESRRRIQTMSRDAKARWKGAPSFTVLTAALAVALGPCQPDARGQARFETLSRVGGQHVDGGLAANAEAGLEFIPRDTAKPLFLDPGSVVEFNGAGPDSLTTPPPFRVLIGQSLRLSGVLREITPSSVSMGV